MTGSFNFAIVPADLVSRHFLDLGISDFRIATGYIRQLRYHRNSDKNDPLIVFKENCGTCGTKHALLKQLASGQQQDEVQLMLCLFKMNRENTPRISALLDKQGLDYLPEAHNYLLVGDEIIDCTRPEFSIEYFKQDILSEITIEPEQISDFKVQYHKRFLQNWLQERPDLRVSLEELWAVREACIRMLSG